MRGRLRALKSSLTGGFADVCSFILEQVEAAVQKVQSSCALKNASGCEQYLGLLDQLEISRPLAYKYILDDASEELLSRIKIAPQGNLLSLLQASFPFIGIEELKRIPLTILERLSPVPANYLKLISRDLSIFRQCSLKVQRQVWVMDKGTLRKHLSSVLDSYGEEKEVVRRHSSIEDVQLAPLVAEEDWSAPRKESEEDLGGAGGQSRGKKIANSKKSSSKANAIQARKEASKKATTSSVDVTAAAVVDVVDNKDVQPRRILRGRSPAIHRLRKVVGDNITLYNAVVREIRTRYANTGDPSTCALRSQFLMAFHDDEVQELCEIDPSHRLAWLMDACVRDRYLDNRRLLEMGNILDSAELASRNDVKNKGKAQPPKKKLKVKFTFGAAAKPTVSESDGGASAVSRVQKIEEVVEPAETILGDMGMILRDPPVFHLLLHETMRTLQFVVKDERQPKTDARLKKLAKFICLALNARELLQKGDMAVVSAVPPEILGAFFPMLADLMIEKMLSEDSDDEDDSDDEEEEEENDDDSDDKGSDDDSDDDSDDEDDDDDDLEEKIEKLSEMITESPAIRKFALMYGIICLKASDKISCKAARLMFESVAKASKDADVVDDKDTYLMLAKRVRGMCELNLPQYNKTKGKKRKKGGSQKNPIIPFSSSNQVWETCVGTALTKASIGSYDIHETILDILAEASKKSRRNKMSPEELGKAVDKVLIATKKTRKVQRKKREASENYTWECEPLPPGATEEKRVESKETIALALRNPSAGSQSPFTMDDLRTKYSEFTTNFGITEKEAPALFAYLSKKEKMKRSRSGLGIAKDDDKKNDNPDSEEEEEEDDDDEGKNGEEDGDTVDDNDNETKGDEDKDDGAGLKSPVMDY
jgi:hypothetical protein